MSCDIETTAQAASGYAAQIEHLSIAADCILTGSKPADPRLCENIALSLLAAINELARATQDATVSIEQALLDQKKAA